MMAEVHGARRCRALPLLVLLLLATAAVGGGGTATMDRAAELSAAVADAEPPEPKEASYAPGARIEIHGLQSDQALNGLLGTAVSPLDAETNRVEISVDGAFFSKKIKPANLKAAPPSSGGDQVDNRGWWAVYDAVAVVWALLTIGLTARCCGVDVCCGLCASEDDNEGATDRPKPTKSPWLAVEVPPASGKDGARPPASPGKISPPASAMSSYSAGTPEWASSRGSQSSRTGSSGSSSRRFPSKPKPAGAVAEARRQKRMRDGLVARRPMVFPEGVDKPQDYINERDWVEWMTKEEEKEAYSQLNDLVSEFRGEKGCPEDRFLCEMTLYRYLRARKGDVEAAASMLEETVAWRRASGVAEETIDCPMCCERPGTHTWRQIGFDRRAMPVIYSCARQEPPGTKVLPQDSNNHMLYALEEAIKTMEPGVTQWVWALDMTGFGLNHASPQLPLHMNALFSRHYPELLGTALIINAPRVFAGLWSWVKRFVDPNTVAKVRFINGNRESIRGVLLEMFPEDLANWLEEEIVANRKGKMAPQQKQWWEPPPHGCDHDPRASPHMLHTYLDPQAPRNNHRPHPSIREIVWPGRFERFPEPPIETMRLG